MKDPNRNIQIDQSHAKIGISYAETVNTEQIGGEIHNYPAQKQNLVEAAAEIQELLALLEEKYPSSESFAQQVILAGTAIEVIESNPPLKSRIIGAIREGGIEALMELIDHPAVRILKAAFEGWQEPK
jgi:hypothetical protein